MGAPRTEQTAHEYPCLSDKYRVRVLRKTSGTILLDIREYVDMDKFQGFTRRGIRLTSKEEVKLLRDSLTDVLKRGYFDKIEREAK